MLFDSVELVSGKRNIYKFYVFTHKNYFVKVSEIFVVDQGKEENWELTYITTMTGKIKGTII